MAGVTGGGEIVNGNYGYRSRARCPSRVYTEIHLQPGSQDYWVAILLSCIGGGFCWDVSIAVDAHSLDLADGGSSVGGGNQAGDLSQPAPDARHHNGLFFSYPGAP